MKGPDVKQHVIATEVVLEAGPLKDVDGMLMVDGGQLVLEVRARGAYEGSLGGSVRLLPPADGAADLSVEVSVKGARPGLRRLDALAPEVARLSLGTGGTFNEGQPQETRRTMVGRCGLRPRTAPIPAWPAP